MSEETRILVVDDESITLDFFDVMLSKLGFNVYKASDGEEALARVKEINPDLIMTDNILPKITGWKFTEILKTSPEYSEYSDIPVIMLSAVSDVKDKIEGYDLGVEDYILKPFNFLEVLARIRAVLRSRQLQKSVIEKEKKLAVTSSLNDSLIYFAKHLKEPIGKIESMMKGLDSSDSTAVAEFISQVGEGIVNFNAAITALEDEISAMNGQEDKSGGLESYMDDLEDKFKSHIAVLSEEELTGSKN